jgi:hypothetical protein
MGGATKRRCGRALGKPSGRRKVAKHGTAMSSKLFGIETFPTSASLWVRRTIMRGVRADAAGGYRTARHARRYLQV